MRSAFVIGLAAFVAALTWAGAEDPLVQAMELPARAEALREAGVDPAEVGVAVRAAKERGVPAGEAAEVLGQSERAVKERGTIDNFGGFVQSKLDEGLRGRELAQAIAEEHRARGKGKPDHAGRPEGEERPGKAGKTGKAGQQPPGKGGKAGQEPAKGDKRGQGRQP